MGSRIINRVFLLLAIAVSVLCAGVSEAQVYTVTGKIQTFGGTDTASSNQPVRHIRVIVMDEDIGFDDVEKTVYTNAAGDFSATFVDFFEAPDIYINLDYYGSAVSGREVEVRFSNSDSDPIHDENIEGVVHDDIPGGTTALGTLRCSTKRANIITNVCTAFRYLKGQYPSYTMPENLKAEGRTSNGASTAGLVMSIAFEDWATPSAGGAASRSDMHHESFHWLAYRAYGNRWPVPNCSGNPHSSNKETCEGFAMQEGSAQYFGNISAIAMFGGDGKSNMPGWAAWRGKDGTGFDNNGEIVEGTFTRVLRMANDHPGFLQVLTTTKPDTWRELKTNYAALRGQTSAQTRALLDSLAANGIIYTRSKVLGFTPADPPDVGPEQNGNFKKIRGISFVRGQVVADIQQSTKAELNIAAASSTDAADQKNLFYKPAVAGLAENGLGGFTPVGAVPWANDLIWDTDPRNDGDYDVLTIPRNAHQWWDPGVDPWFGGDATAAVNSNEKWLKRLRTWYNQDASPNNDKEGKVVVDNTSPEVSNFKPAP
ncbi:MAG: hypothetical protein ACE5FH_07890 [Candidatus Zixiibacteriota bacterium]